MKLLSLLITFLIIIQIVTKLHEINDNIKNNPKAYIKNKIIELFIVSIKDKQKVGTTENDDGTQPRSTWKSGNRNAETCYSTETRNGNTTGRSHGYLCDQGIDGSETIPADGLYTLNFSNYNIHYGKKTKGKRLVGSHTTKSGKTLQLDADGLSNDETLTLKQAKSFCDELKGKCMGFIMMVPTKTDPRHYTYFIASLEEGSEDPDTYSKLHPDGIDITNSNIISYIKKDPNAIEQPINDTRVRNMSSKYQNMPTCNWKSADKCIFRDYKYNQSENNCISKDDNPKYSVPALNNYSQDDLKDWLKLLYTRDIGTNKPNSEASNVYDYADRCKEVPGYDFLDTLGFQNPYIPTTKPGDVKGRYVRITTNNVTLHDAWLNFAELQVISNNRSIAVGKPSSASSNTSNPSKGNDGNSNPNLINDNYNDSSVFLSNNDGGPQYWEVDLGDASKTIDRVIVAKGSTTASWGQQILSSWLLSVYDNNKNLIWARIFRDPPNPKVSIDILNVDNDMNNIRVKDYNQSKFNTYYRRVSDTEYNSKRGWDGKGCYDTCHKEICENEKKKWIGNSNWYGCRDYKTGEFEADQANSVIFSINNPSIPTLSLNNFPKLGNISKWELDINFNVTGYGQDSNWRPIIGDMYNNYNNRGWGVWISPSNNIHFSWQSVTWNAEPQFNVQLNTNYNLKISMTSTSLTLLLTNLNNNTSQTSTNNSISGYNMTTNGPVTIGGWINYSGERFPGTISSISVVSPSVFEHTFTTAGASGSNGPSLADIRTAYSGVSWAQDSNVLNMTTQGIQLWTVPLTGNYTIRAVGARGGNSLYGPRGGHGIDISTTTTLYKGEIIKILVGQMGKDEGQPPSWHSFNTPMGGGGGTFVVRGTNTPIIVAGGGGSATSNRFLSTYKGNYNGGEALASTNGGGGGFSYGAKSIFKPGVNGNGSTIENVYTGTGFGGQGGGLLSDGTDTAYEPSGKGFVNGGRGGSNFGGFGGGACAYNNSGISSHGGGGGGGYSGGAGAIYSYVNANEMIFYQAGGGGSYALSTMTVNGWNSGAGYVNIKLVSKEKAKPVNDRCARHSAPHNLPPVANRIYGNGPVSGKNCPVTLPDSFCCGEDGTWREPVFDGNYIWYYDTEKNQYFHTNQRTASG